MGILESRNFLVHPLCRNTPKSGSSRVAGEVSQFGFVDSGADSSKCCYSAFGCISNRRIVKQKTNCMDSMTKVRGGK